MGKTALALNIAENVALLNRAPVAIFSLEMGKEQLVQRLLCSRAEIDSSRVRTGQLRDDDWAKLGSAMGELGEAPIFIDDSAGVTVMELRGKCRRLKAQHGDLGLVIIDYLQLIEGRSNNDNRVNQMGEISRGLKLLARELNVPIIALSQLSRAVESRQDKRPMLSDLRDSGAIEQDADIVLMIYRDEYYNPETEKAGIADLIIAKQRSGPVGSLELVFQSNITKFKNPARM
jgi:replicative DNA helicase